MSYSNGESKNAIVEECKNVTLQQLRNSLGIESIVSMILYGSVARNEEKYSYREGKRYLESDIDLLVIIRNIDILKCMRSLTALSGRITHELRKTFLLSQVSLIVTTEKKLLNAKPSMLSLELKMNGRVIFGKDVISLISNYKSNDIPVRRLTRYIFSFMVRLLEDLVYSDLKQVTPDYDPIIKSMVKMTSTLIRVLVIKDAVPVNPFSLDEIKIKNKHHSKNSELIKSLLEDYDDLKKIKSPSQLSREDMKKYWVRIVNQFNLTVEALTGNKDVRTASSETELLGGSVKLFRRLTLALYISPRFFALKTIGDLTKAVILIIRVGPDYSYLPLFQVFISIPSLLESVDKKNTGSFPQRDDFRAKLLNSFEKNFEIWNLSSCIFADQF